MKREREENIDAFMKTRPFFLHIAITLLDYPKKELKYHIKNNTLVNAFRAVQNALYERYEGHQVKGVSILVQLKNGFKYNITRDDVDQLIVLFKAFAYIESFGIAANISAALVIDRNAKEQIESYIQDHTNILKVNYNGRPYTISRLLDFRINTTPVEAYYHWDMKYYNEPEKSKQRLCSSVKKLEEGFVWNAITMLSAPNMRAENEAIYAVRMYIHIESGLEVPISKVDCNNMLGLLTLFPNVRVFEIYSFHESSALYQLKIQDLSALDYAVIHHPSIYKAYYDGIIPSVQSRLEDKKLLDNISKER